LTIQEDFSNNTGLFQNFGSHKFKKLIDEVVRVILNDSRQISIKTYILQGLYLLNTWMKVVAMLTKFWILENQIPKALEVSFRPLPASEFSVNSA
jgi:hypothetical protein